MMARRLLAAVNHLQSLPVYDRLDLTPKKLFIITMAGLTGLYTLEFALGGERGAASYLSPDDEINSNEDSGVPAHRNETYSLTETSNSTSAGTPVDSRLTDSTPKANNLYSLLTFFLVVCGVVIFILVLFQKISEGIRMAYFGEDGYNGATTRRGAILRNRALAMQMLERLRGLRNVLGRDITPDDYEALLGLDGNTVAADRGVSQGLINRCPTMVMTQEQINRMIKCNKTRDPEQDEELPQSRDDSSEDSPDCDYSCTVCLEDFRVGDQVRTLPCLHSYHCSCIDTWLLEHGDCPICKIRLDEV